MTSKRVRTVWLTVGILTAGSWVMISGPSTHAVGGITEFPVPAHSGPPQSIAAGADGNLWFTENGFDAITSATKIGRITTSGVINEFAYTPNSGIGSPTGITAGPDSALWFTESAGNEIGRMTTAGAFTSFPINPDCCTMGIATGPDGNLWFDHNTDNYGFDRMTTAGVITKFTDNIDNHQGPNTIATGSDANLWLTNPNLDTIAQVTTAGVVTPFTLPAEFTGPSAIAAGGDGNLWFTDSSGRIGRMTTAGVVTGSFAVAAGTGDAITAGPDGALWFTRNDNRIGRIATDGTQTSFLIPTAGSNPADITAGSDGNIWFTELSGHKIGRLYLGTASPPAKPTGVVAKPGSTTSSATGPIIVSYVAGANNGAPITKFTATCTSSNGGTTKSAVHNGASAVAITVGGATLKKSYTCTVKATNIAGNSAPSAASPAIIVGAPARVATPTVVKVAAGQLRVSFTPLTSSEANGSALTTPKYTATCTSGNGGATRSATGTGSPIVVTSLTPGKTYTCTVKAHNARGYGRASAASTAHTA